MGNIYHCANARSMRPLWTLEEMGLDLRAGSPSLPALRVFAKEYLAVNPLGTIPFFRGRRGAHD